MPKLVQITKQIYFKISYKNYYKKNYYKKNFKRAGGALRNGGEA